MKSKLIEKMIRMVESGIAPNQVWESTLTFHPGSTAKVNKDTIAKDYMDPSVDVNLAKGSVVSIVGVGGGPSGVDYHVQDSEGRQMIIPFADLGESYLKNNKKSRKFSEQLTGAVVNVKVTKPLPQSAVDWIEGGYTVYNVQLPSKPTSDSDSEIEFLMKADDQETIDAAIESLKKAAGTSFESADPATMVDWSDHIGL